MQTRIPTTLTALLLAPAFSAEAQTPPPPPTVIKPDGVCAT